MVSAIFIDFQLFHILTRIIPEYKCMCIYQRYTIKQYNDDIEIHLRHLNGSYVCRVNQCCSVPMGWCRMPLCLINL